ncbi:MAG: hypothetical protein FWD82_08960, partial [Defluviitaleaceae bacterium]|nr:hypothetical protein [Defluviitaleaceae bacterium]
GGGLFLIGQSISVTNVFGAWRMFGFAVPSGLVVLPLLIGIGMLFYNHKSKAWKIVTGFGVLFILLSVILSIRIVVHRVTFFDFILMFGLTAAGVAMLLRFWFYDRK